MTVVLGVVSEKSRVRQMQKIYANKLQELLPISMEQLSKGCYNFEEIWVPKDLKMSA